MRRTVSVTVLLVLATLLAACSQPPVFEGNLSGQVLTGNDRGLAGATVTAMSADATVDPSALQAQAVDTARTDDRGYFDLTLPAGRYLVTVIGDGFGVMRTVDVTGDPVELNLTARALGHVHGTVVRDGAGDLGGVQVQVLGTGKTAFTTSGGEYVINGLPAGDYLLGARAGDDVSASDVAVTVVAGGTVQAEPLTLVGGAVGPVIESVSDHLLFLNESEAYLGSELTTLTINGSGFGDTINLSQVLYAGMPVSPLVIADWSDTAITLEFHHPAELFGLFFPGGGFALAAVAAEDGILPFARQRFEVRTLGGVAVSDPVRFIAVELDVDHASTTGSEVLVELEVYDLFEGSPVNEAFTLQASRGTLGTTSLVSDATGYAETTLVTGDPAPHVVSVLYDGEVVAQDVTMCCYLYSSTGTVPADQVTPIDLTVETYTGSLVVGETFDVRLVEMGYSPFAMPTVIELGQHTTDEAGQITLDLPALPVNHDYEILLVQDGAVIDYEYFSVSDTVPL